MKLQYIGEIDIQNALNNMFWQEVNSYSEQQVQGHYDKIVRELRSSQRPIYYLKRMYDIKYRESNLSLTHTFDSTLQALKSTVLQDLRNQFAYEHAISKLIIEQALIPASCQNLHISNYCSGCVIEVELFFQGGNTFCNLFFEFPYSCLRISPFIK